MITRAIAIYFLSIWRRLQFPYAYSERKKQFIFIHIPKNAGSTIRKQLQLTRKGRLHLPWYVYYCADPLFYNKAYKFAVVRNPWDRAVSSYMYLRQGGNGVSDYDVAEAMRSYKDFGDFLLRGLGQGKHLTHLMFLPQSSFIYGPNDKLMVDDVLRYEKLDAEFGRVAKRLNCSATLVRRTNSSQRHRDYRHYYSDKRLVSLISEIYRQDAALIGYRFDELI